MQELGVCVDACCLACIVVANAAPMSEKNEPEADTENEADISDSDEASDSNSHLILTQTLLSLTQTLSSDASARKRQ